MRALLQVTVVLAASIVQVDGSCTNVQCGTGAECAVGPLSCDWVANNYNTGGQGAPNEEVYLGDTNDPAECIALCRDAPGTGGVPFDLVSLDDFIVTDGTTGECWCQYGNDLRVDPDPPPYLVCALSTVFTDGYTCSCGTGYEGTAVDDGPATCTDIDGCDGTNCGPNASCEDVDAPGTGYTCACNSGYEGSATTDEPATCNEVTCTRPTTTGYDFSNVDEYSLYGSEFEVNDVACASGYEGTPTTAVCTVDNGPYVVSGCNVAGLSQVGCAVNGGARSTAEGLTEHMQCITPADGYSVDADGTVLISRTVLCDRYNDNSGGFCNAFVSEGQLREAFTLAFWHFRPSTLASRLLVAFPSSLVAIHTYVHAQFNVQPESTRECKRCQVTVEDSVVTNKRWSGCY